jgi:phage gp36-like protein
MAYSTIADVKIAAGGERALRELSDVDSSNAVNNAAVESAIVEADALIDSYLLARYAVPLSTTPPVINHLSRAIAVWVLKGRRRNLLTEQDSELHAAHLVQLEALATGKATLGVYPEPTKSELLRYEASDRPNDKAISREALKGFC